MICNMMTLLTAALGVFLSSCSAGFLDFVQFRQSSTSDTVSDRNLISSLENLAREQCLLQCSVEDSCVAVAHNVNGSCRLVRAISPALTSDVSITDTNGWSFYEPVMSTCEENWSGGSSSCYYASVEVLTWADSQTVCEKLGGHLATVTTQSEMDTVVRVARTQFSLEKDSDVLMNNYIWVGGNDISTEDSWIWITNEKWDYTNWGQGEPNGKVGENCLGLFPMSDTNPMWHDFACDKQLLYICEKERATSSTLEQFSATSSKLVTSNTVFTS